jgi:trans-aconitate methyltransferase
MPSVDRRCCPEGAAELERDEGYYDRVKQNKNKHWQLIPTRRVTWYPALLLVRGSVFDVGCGTGHMAEMCRAFGIDYCCGIDFSYNAIHTARRRNPSLEFHWKNVFEAQELFEQDYDTALFVEVLEHVYRDLDLLDMVPQGRTVVGSVPSFWTEGHCRWFATPSQVRDRYGQKLGIDRIVTETAINGSNSYFMFRGVKL